MNPLLKVRGLSVAYRRRGTVVPAVRGISLEVAPGESLGIAGESGSGKSTVALALLRLLPKSATLDADQMEWEGRDLTTMSERDLRRIRGGEVGIVFQDPFSALNPVMTVGEQIEEVLALHGGERDRRGALALMERVHLPDPEGFHKAYPHQLSGGQRQRVCLAMAIAGSPKLLIADEPTTALDVTVQRGILALLDELRAGLKMALLLVSHNMGLLSERTDRLAVMYAGEIVETGPTSEVLGRPTHPYTRGLLASLPRLSRRESRLPALPGQPPDPREIPTGCPFRPRCPLAFDLCAKEPPRLRAMQEGNRFVSCHGVE